MGNRATDYLNHSTEVAVTQTEYIAALREQLRQLIEEVDGHSRAYIPFDAIDALLAIDPESEPLPPNHHIVIANSDWSDVRFAAPKPEPEKPWAGNRNGDPRQLLHEAAVLERRAKGRRKAAQEMRKEAVNADREARRMEYAAADYREWAKGRT